MFGQAEGGPKTFVLWSDQDATNKKNQQEQDAKSPEPQPSQGGELYGLQKVRPGQAATRRL